MGKSGTPRSSSTNISEAIPVVTVPRKTPSEKGSSQDLRQQTLDNFKELESVSKKILKNKEAYVNIESIIEDHALQKAIAESSIKELEDMKKLRELQIDEFAEKYKQWKEKEDEIKNDARITEETMRNAHAEKISTLNKEISTLKDKLEAADKDAQSLRKEVAATRQHCKETREELDLVRKKKDRLEQNFAPLDDTALETHEEEAKKLRDRSLGLLSFFKGDLSESMFTDYPEWEKHESALKLKFRLPASNSPAAKAVRIAASLCTFGICLSTISNRSWYNPASADDSETVAEALRASFKDDIGKNSLARSLFLSNYERDEVQAAIRNDAKTASQKVFEKLKFFITNDEEKYQSDLDKLFQDWADFWLKMQYSKDQVEATLDEEEDSEEDWIMMQELGEESSIEGEDSQSVPLFPCIYSSVTSKVIQPGYFLCMDQEQVVDAEKEAKSIARNRRTVQRSHIRRRSATLFTPPGNMSNIGRPVAQ